MVMSTNLSTALQICSQLRFLSLRLVRPRQVPCPQACSALPPHCSPLCSSIPASPQTQLFLKALSRPQFTTVSALCRLPWLVSSPPHILALSDALILSVLSLIAGGSVPRRPVTVPLQIQPTAHLHGAFKSDSGPALCQAQKGYLVKMSWSTRSSLFLALPPHDHMRGFLGCFLS